MLKKVSNTRPLTGTVVNANDDSTTNAYSVNYINNCNKHSTNEVDTGKVWIDGKKIYRKIIDFGNAPNNTTKNVSCNISNFGTLVKLEGIATASNGYATPLPQVVPNGQNQIQVFFQNDNVSITTVSDKSTYYCYFILEYTKTTD